MVAEHEKDNTITSSDYMDGEINGTNGADYDNIELTAKSMSLISVGTVKNEEDDTKTLEKIPSYRSTTASPTCSALTQEPSHVSMGPPVRLTRSYRIIDSNVSQKILQQLAADKVAAVQGAGKGTKFLKRKGSNKGVAIFLQRQPSTNSQIWREDDELSLLSSSLDVPRLRTHFDVVRTSSFGGNPAQMIRKNLDCNRNSLPLNIITMDFDEVEANCLSSNPAAVSESATQRSSSISILRKMAAALDGGPRKSQNHSSATLSMATNEQHHYANGTNGGSNADDDQEGVQRLSFVSSSTGYSSARSSLRSSEICDEAGHSCNNVSVGRKLLTQESSLSEIRRLKLINSGTATQLDRISMELLETERSYVNDLNDVIQGYLNFLVDHRDEFEMTVDDISNTFGCIERIFLFNKKLYHELDAAQLSVVSMAKCFLNNINGFNDYVTYCTKYQIMTETLSTLMKNKKIAEILKLRQTVLGHSLPLSAYLLKPVQRVLKYHLFLENILKNSMDTKSLSDGDRAVIRQAFHSMTAQAEKINEEKKRVEHLERVRELQNALHKWCIDEREDLSKYGDLLLEATFKLAGAKTNRQLFLFEEMLLIVKERNGALICKDYIMCSSLMLNESISTDPLAFQVLSYDNPKIQYIFLASNIDQKRNWMKELKRMMLDHYTVQIPEKTKMLMLSMDDDCTKSMNSFHQEGQIINLKGTKKVPKYLERRRKSIDANQTFRRAQVRKRSCSSSRSVLKASSTGNLVRELEMFQEANSAPKAATHSSSFITVNKPSTSASLQNTCGLECEEFSGHSPGFQNLFFRKKTNESNRKKSTIERKDNVSHLPPPILKEHKILNNVAENFSATGIKQERNDDASRCHCLVIEPTQSTYGIAQSNCANKKGNCCAQKHFDDTMNILYRELQLLIKSAENLGNVDNNDTSDVDDVTRTNAERQREAVQRLDALVNGCKDLNSLSKETKRRSRSLNKFDEALFDEGQRRVDETKKFCLSFIDNISANSTSKISDDDLETFLNDSLTGTLECSTFQFISKDVDEPVNVVSWTESPHVNEKCLGSNYHRNIHHRRRSSQVAEQVWRLRQKQAQNRKSIENCADKKPPVVSMGKTGEPPVKDQMSTRAPKLPRSVAKHYDFAESGHRRSVGTLLARQRSPLTVEQCAELDGVLETNLGVVKKMIKQLEKPKLCIKSHQHDI